jgi:hypothetical protein
MEGILLSLIRNPKDLSIFLLALSDS